MGYKSPGVHLEVVIIKREVQYSRTINTLRTRSPVVTITYSTLHDLPGILGFGLLYRTYRAEPLRGAYTSTKNGRLNYFA